ncbi:MAG TPA: helicase C-terminal domain-containing protein, partial [Ignavibacteriaceae bacterium]
ETEVIVAQQIGRLIRTMKDFGVVSILDIRFSGKFPSFQKLIPNGMMRVRTSAEDVKEGSYREIGRKLLGMEYDPTVFTMNT